MIREALLFIVQVPFGLLIMALLLRFHLQWVRAHYRNPLTPYVNTLTDFMVLRARHFVPGLWGMDLSTLLLAWLLALLLTALTVLIGGYGVGAAAGNAIFAMAGLGFALCLKYAVYLLIFFVIAQAVLSWVNPDSPAYPIVNVIVRPFSAPFRKWIPPLGNIDLSPLIVLVICQLVLMLPVYWLEAGLFQLLRQG